MAKGGVGKGGSGAATSAKANRMRLTGRSTARNKKAGGIGMTELSKRLGDSFADAQDSKKRQARRGVGPSKGAASRAGKMSAAAKRSGSVNSQAANANAAAGNPQTKSALLGTALNAVTNKKKGKGGSKKK